jgi:hypothetical protein
MSRLIGRKLLMSRGPARCESCAPDATARFRVALKSDRLLEGDLNPAIWTTAGVQWFSYALFFVDAQALQFLDKSDGWAIGSDPNVVVINRGAGTYLGSQAEGRTHEPRNG